MDSGIYCLAWPESGFFYIGKSDCIPKRWKQHQSSFEKGKHARRMQEQFDKEGPPEYRLFLRCHMDHIDLYESIIIRHNLGPYCLNGALPREIPKEEIEVLINAAEHIEMSTADHIKQLKALELEKEIFNKTLEATNQKLEDLYERGIDLPEEHKAFLETTVEKAMAYKTSSEKYKSELIRLKSLSLWRRIFNYKVQSV